MVYVTSSIAAYMLMEELYYVQRSNPIKDSRALIMTFSSSILFYNKWRVPTTRMLLREATSSAMVARTSFPASCLACKPYSRVQHDCRHHQKETQLIIKESSAHSPA